MTEAWDSNRGGVFRTLTFNGEPYTEYNHYDFYDHLYGEDQGSADVTYEQLS